MRLHSSFSSFQLSDRILLYLNVDVSRNGILCTKLLYKMHQKFHIKLQNSSVQLIKLKILCMVKIFSNRLNLSTFENLVICLLEGSFKIIHLTKVIINICSVEVTFLMHISSVFLCYEN